MLKNINQNVNIYVCKKTTTHSKFGYYVKFDLPERRKCWHILIPIFKLDFIGSKIQNKANYTNL